MKILHSASLKLVDGCNVIVLLGISANQRNTEDSGGRKVNWEWIVRQLLGYTIAEIKSRIPV